MSKGGNYYLNPLNQCKFVRTSDKNQTMLIPDKCYVCTTNGHFMDQPKSDSLNSYDNYCLDQCVTSKIRRYIHYCIFCILIIMTIVSITLLFVGVFLNCRTCLTIGCILGIACFGAWLHDCLRHRTLPNSTMPFVLGHAYIYPMFNLPIARSSKLYPQMEFSSTAFGSEDGLNLDCLSKKFDFGLFSHNSVELINKDKKHFLCNIYD